MRKYHQKQLLDLITTLREANTQMNYLLLRKESSAAVQLLSDCQKSAVEIGEFIERMEGEGTKTVSLLEEYCELLYQAGEGIINREGGSEFPEQIEKLLVDIEGNIKTELKPNRIEMVFLPYKASMWDSMESIWLAAKDDPQCEALVIPIPYFDKLPGGAFGQMQYEGDQYPDNVPIVDWRKFNLEKSHPDVIVIHSPYDEGNQMTSIHPDFYCKRIKDSTDLLVYTPYFVCPDDIEEVLCISPGTLYADKVIVQSEKVRDTYIRTIRSFEKENNCPGFFGDLDAKFAVLGSPKLDRINNTGMEDYQIPDEWQKRIVRPDGTRRKVIFYNTSIASLLAENEKALIKLEYVFDCFRDQDDVVLLWRPHPLNNVAYQSMRPELLDGYGKIVKWYREQGFGIYDDTADLHRAVALSDAYYGDGGSLVAYFLCAGKPVMLQDYSVNQENLTLTFENLYEDTDHFWFTSYHFNALFRMDKQTWETEYMGSFTDEKRQGWRLYGPITAYGGNLYFAPILAGEISEYNPECNTFRQLGSLSLHKKINAHDWKGPKFLNAVKYKDYLFLIGCFYPAIIRIDLPTGEADFFTDWLEPLKKLMAVDDGYYFRSACAVGPLIIAAALNTNAVVVFDMDSCTSKVYEVGSKGYKYSGICYDSSNYWLSPRFSGPVVKWNPSGAYKEYWGYPDGFDANGYGFWNICYSGGYVWLLPAQANMAIKICILDEHISVADEFQKECETDLPGMSYIFSTASKDMIYAFTGKTNRLLCLDCKTNRLREGNVLLSEKDTEAVRSSRRTAFMKAVAARTSIYHFIYYERAFLQISDYIKHIADFNEFKETEELSNKQVDIFRNTIQNADGTSGKEVYACCKHEVMP
jgi:hypothetical protein